MAFPHHHRGQAAVELLGVVPALLVLGLVAWQIAAAAHAWQLAGGAARAAARAAAVSAPADRAARAVLPAVASHRARVTRVRGPGGEARLRVALPIPSVLPRLPPLGLVSAGARAGP